jgi:ferredoxin
MAFATQLLDQYGKRVRIVPEDEAGRMDLNPLLSEPKPDTLVYCCGPAGLLQSVLDRGSLWPPEAIRTERFAAKAIEQTEPDGEFVVETSITGYTVSVPADSTVLEALTAAGVDVLYSCREGTCGTCETRVLSGTVDHRDSLLTPAEQAANDTMMVCVSRASSPKLVLEL